MSVEVRLAVLADAEAIARVQVVTWRAAYRGILPDKTLEELDEGFRAGKWREWLVRDDITIVVTEHEGVVIGFASSGASRDEDARVGTYEIHAIYVDPNHWRSGQGRALTERTIEIARTKKATSITLWVLEGNMPARRFYESMGFTLDGGRKVDRIDTTEVVELRYGMTV